MVVHTLPGGYRFKAAFLEGRFAALFPKEVYDVFEEFIVTYDVVVGLMSFFSLRHEIESKV